MGIGERIKWLGAQPQQQVLEQYRNSDLFVLTSKIIADGDRDGLPNVLMEAQSQGLCCLATDISGIPELIEHQKSGYLVPSQNSQATSQALQKLITNPALRQALGKAGFQRIRDEFSVEQGIDKLVKLFSS